MAKKKSEPKEIIDTAQTYEHFIGQTEQVSLGDFFEEEIYDEDDEQQSGPTPWELAALEKKTAGKKKYFKELIVHVTNMEDLLKFGVALDVQLSKRTNEVVYKPMSTKSIFDELAGEE